MGRRSQHPSATACFATMWCKITLQSTITFTCTCICPCSAPSMDVSILNMAAMTCGFTLAGSTIYPPDMRQYHRQRSLKGRSESPIKCQRHSASELNMFFQDSLGGCLPWMCRTPLAVPDTGWIGRVKALNCSFSISIQD